MPTISLTYGLLGGVTLVLLFGYQTFLVGKPEVLTLLKTMEFGPGIPARGLSHRISVLVPFLPRILAGESITEKEIALLGHGGLCLNCPDCIYPGWAFGIGAWRPLRNCPDQ